MGALIYFLIGFIVASINNHLWTKLETLDEQSNDNPSMIIALVGWIILWPLALIGMVVMFREYYRRKNNE